MGPFPPLYPYCCRVHSLFVWNKTRCALVNNFSAYGRL
jgi:hypothetical protein